LCFLFVCYLGRVGGGWAGEGGGGEGREDPAMITYCMEMVARVLQC